MSPRRHGRLLAGLVLASLALITAPARADDAPAPQLGLGAPQLTDAACTPGSPAGCQRLRFAYGPITVNPGANMQLLALDAAKPLYDGYVTRLTANLFRTDGSIPPVDEVHLHHGAWLSNPQYGNFPVFFAAGEEKTHLQVPSGYGMKVMGSDKWSLGYMLHNLYPTTEHVYITYDLDYTPAGQAESNGIKPVKPLWLDVMNRTRPLYPVFNVQRGFGHYSKKYKRKVCVFPKERCAAFDPYGFAQPGNGSGWDWVVPKDYDGTIVGMGGHVHPGGLEDQVSLVRGRRVKRVFNSEAKYWDKDGPVSWDMAMTVTNPDYRLRIRAGDKIRLNAVYDSQQASWYENMGIVMAFVAPGDTSGVDVFAKDLSSTAKAQVSVKGDVTHGHLAENDHHGGTGARKLPTKTGPVVNKVTIHNFVYSPGDLSNSTSIPAVKLKRGLTFFNADDVQGIWHTVTPCKRPCTAETGIAYPLANAMPRIDSLELGKVHPLLKSSQAASGKVSFKLLPKKAGLKVGRTYTYFCRIHPFMRGAFKVVK